MSYQSYFVYILFNKYNTVNYTGVTNDLPRRIAEHKNKTVDGFTERYGVSKLVYFEEYGDIHDALNREKEIKAWRKEKKPALIKTKNPDYNDLTRDIFG